MNRQIQVKPTGSLINIQLPDNLPRISGDYVNLTEEQYAQFAAAAIDGDPVIEAARWDLVFGTAAANGIYQFLVPFTLPAAGGAIKSFKPGFAGTLKALDIIITAAGAGAGATAIFNLDIGGTNTTGGAATVALAAATLGNVVNATAITAANTITADQAVTLEAATVTAYTSGTALARVTILRTA